MSNTTDAPLFEDVMVQRTAANAEGEAARYAPYAAALANLQNVKRDLDADYHDLLPVFERAAKVQAAAVAAGYTSPDLGGSLAEFFGAHGVWSFHQQVTETFTEYANMLSPGGIKDRANQPNALLAMQNLPSRLGALGRRLRDLADRTDFQRRELEARCLHDPTR
jgi:hypothetical protein